jgi:alpha-beta hydrolase superfamily lysophospholipase
MSRPLYIDTPAGPVSGFLHPAAADRAEEGKAAVLFCAPWGWNEAVSYRSRRTWAEALAAEGHPVLRFDLPAVGDSSGSPSDPGLLGRWIEAVAAAGGYLAGVAPGREIAALGMEIGGLLALEAARQGAPIEALAMWAPPRDGRGFVRATRAFSRMQRWSGGPDGDSPLPEGWMEAAGFVLSAETVAALGELKPIEEAPPAGLRRVLVLGRDEMAPEQALADHLAAGGAEVEVAPGPGWEGMVTHPGYAVPPPPTMERFSRWLADGPAPGDPGGERLDAVDDASGEMTIAVGDAGVREAPLEGLAAQTFGVLSEPVAGTDSDECVVFLNAGAIRHTGPNRVWVDSARELAAAGVRSVRLDLAGIGEGEGESARFAEISEFYDPAFGEQIEAAMTTIEASGPARRFTVIGLCSGGYWSFRIGIDDRRVERIIPLNPGAFRWRHSLVMEQDGKGLSMLTEGRLWRKLLRGEFDLKKIRAFALLAVRRVGEKLRSLLGSGAGEAEESRREPKLEADLDALRESGTEVVIAFSTDERPAVELRRSGIVAEIGRWPNTSLVDLPGVDHAIASTSAQAAARELIRSRILGERGRGTAPSSRTAPSLSSDVQAAAD